VYRVWISVVRFLAKSYIAQGDTATFVLEYLCMQLCWRWAPLIRYTPRHNYGEYNERFNLSLVGR